MCHDYVVKGRVLLSEARKADFDDHCWIARRWRIDGVIRGSMENRCPEGGCGTERTTERREHVLHILLALLDMVKLFLHWTI